MTTLQRNSLLAGTGILISVLLIFACNTQSTITTAKPIASMVKPPFRSVDVAFTTFTVNPTKNDSFTVSSGSRILIPKGALIDSLGFPVTEACDISYREFMGPAEILASGIPMAFKNTAANLNRQFVSAGMFELKGKTVTGKAIRISATIPVVVELASNNSKEGFSNFYLDVQTGDWIYSGEEQLKKNQRKIDLNKQITKLKESLAFANKNYFVLNAMTMLDVYLNEDYTKISKYYGKKNKQLPNRFLKYGIKSSDMYCGAAILFNKRELPADYIVWENSANATFPAWTKNSYVSVKHISGTTYELSATNAKKESFKTRIKAVMTIKHLFSFGPEYWTSNYEEAMQQIKADEERLATMSEVTRTLQVNQFGIHNCDKFYSEPELFFVEASFSFPGNTPIKPEDIFYVSKKNKSLIPYAVTGKPLIRLCNDESATLIAVLQGNLLAEIPETELNALKAAPQATVTHHFDFKVKAKINSVEDIKKAMGI